MKTRVITFEGGEIDKYGMPKKFHRYSIFVSLQPSLGPGNYVASVMAYTSGAPEPSRAHFVANSENAAIDLVVTALRALKANKGLKES